MADFIVDEEFDETGAPVRYFVLFLYSHTNVYGLN